MKRRALVVASQIDGLQGPEVDAARVRDALAARGFEVELRIGAEATRDGVLARFRALIDASAAGDAAVFYYSGHGARFVNPDADAGRFGLPRVGQLIVPTDYRAGTADDFRGITSWELSLLLAALTRKTDNVAVLFDCCHAAQICRDNTDAVPRALPHPVRLGVARHLAALRAQGARFDDLQPLGDPRAVRLFAAGLGQSAYEHEVAGVGRTGVFTDALVWALDQTRDVAVTWATIGRAIRDRVVRQFATQWPELGGPVERELFSTHVPARTGAVSIVVRDDRARVRTGQITGARVGDRFRIMPMGAGADDRAAPLAIATITAVGALESVVALDAWTATPALVPEGAVAFPEVRCVPAPGPGGTPRIEGGGGGAVDEVAVAPSLRALVGAGQVSADAARLSWGVVVGGEPRPQPDRGAVLGLRDRLYLRIDNLTPATVHVHVFNLGVGGKIVRLNASAVLGIPLPPGEHRTLGEVAGRGLVGLKLRWPAGVARDRPRTDEWYVIATTSPADLGGLQTEPQPRLAGAPEVVDGFVVARFEFELQPRDVALGGAAPVEGEAD